MYYLYILKCRDNTLYTGITTNLERRIKEHNFSKLGSKYTATRRPVSIIYQEEHADRSAASKREFFIKNLDRISKLKLIKK